MTLPSTRPVLKLKISGFALLNLAIAFESPTGSLVLSATAVTPLNCSVIGSSGVPAAAFRAQVFLTPAYLTPASRYLRHHSYSFLKLHLVNIHTYHALTSRN